MLPIPEPDLAGAFPEDRFPCAPCSVDRYGQAVERGRQRMRSASLLICGLARDIASALPYTIARVERLGSMFGRYQVVIYENDSQDGTPDLLRTWSDRNPAVLILSEVLKRQRWPMVRSTDRAADMAGYRNQYLQSAVQHFSSFDYMAVLDTDLPDGFSYEGVASTFGLADWDVVGSNGIQHRHRDGEWYQAHFDAWAFRDVGHPQPHAPQEINPRSYSRGQPMVPVWSCFGGLAIYRMQAIGSGVAYHGTDCEHVTLHLRLRSMGFDRIYLNPSQIVLYRPRP